MWSFSHHLLTLTVPPIHFTRHRTKFETVKRYYSVGFENVSNRTLDLWNQAWKVAYFPHVQCAAAVSTVEHYKNNKRQVHFLFSLHVFKCSSVYDLFSIRNASEVLTISLSLCQAYGIMYQIYAARYPFLCFACWFVYCMNHVSHRCMMAIESPSCMKHEVWMVVMQSQMITLKDNTISISSFAKFITLFSVVLFTQFRSCLLFWTFLLIRSNVDERFFGRNLFCSCWKWHWTESHSILIFINLVFIWMCSIPNKPISQWYVFVYTL